ncbi:YwqG family protein [Laceyella putida]|uniref:YwqG family protein n=1 Tax=Laceyella putida TaxID=110101 RepID=A0ABW2RJ97_9BACL
MKEKIEKLIEQSDLLSELKPEIKRLLSYTIALDFEVVEPGSLPTGSSKIGGRPELPPDFEWPWVHEKVTLVEENGPVEKVFSNPLMFVAQINLADLAAIKPDLFPNNGILYFFDDYNGSEEGWKVIYYDGPMDNLVRIKHPEENEEEKIDLRCYNDIRLNECSIRFCPEWMLPLTENEKVWSIMSPERLGDRYQEQKEIYNNLLDQIRSLSPSRYFHRILGYPDAWEVWDLTYTGEQEKEEWLLLLQLGDDNRAMMSWGDGGCLNYWIRPEDLKNKYFNNIYRWWEQGC